MGVYEDLITWSATRPAWQRDALRRLADQSRPGTTDNAALADLAVAEARGEGGTPGATPLTAAHVPVTSVAGAPLVVLRAIAVENVNALLGGARLEFEASGLTIVYGDNGSGKSGYVRVLKKVCRARAAGAGIHPNVFSAVRGPITATVDFDVNGHANTSRWNQSVDPPPELGAVSVYDRECASVYVTGENEVAYRPFGLDLLDGLAQVMDHVRTELERRKGQLRRALPDPPAELVGSSPFTGLWPLRRGIADATIENRSTWSDEDAGELAALERALSDESPANRAIALRSVHGSYTKAQRRVHDVAQATAAAAIDALMVASGVLHDASAALDIVRGEAFADAPLAGAGGDAWRQLWEAARRFAQEVAYPGHEFPDLQPGARCVLCGQALDEESVRRFAAFEAFVQGEISAAEAVARERVEGASRPLVRFLASNEQDDSLVAELGAIDADLAATMDLYLDNARSRARSALEALENSEWGAVREAGTSPVALLEEAAERRATEINLLDRASRPEESGALRLRRTELRARRWLNEHRAEMVAEIQRLDSMAVLDRAMATCDTHPVTNESNLLTDRYVSAKLA